MQTRKSVIARIGEAKQTIQLRNLLLWPNYLRRSSNMRIFNVIVQITLVYCSETWEINTVELQKISAVKMDFLRKRCGISRLKYVKNKAKIICVKTPLIWCGHVNKKRMTVNIMEKAYPKQ